MELPVGLLSKSGQASAIAAIDVVFYLFGHRIGWAKLARPDADADADTDSDLNLDPEHEPVALRH